MVYRKELGKVNKANRSGAGEHDIYKPALWCYDLLHFLNDQETPRQSRNTSSEDEEFTVDQTSEKQVRIKTSFNLRNYFNNLFQYFRNTINY